jgi:hypothetical protein
VVEIPSIFCRFLICGIRVIRGSSAFRNFPRNAPQNFTKYLSERPEMTPKHFGAKEGQNNERK